MRKYLIFLILVVSISCNRSFSKVTKVETIDTTINIFSDLKPIVGKNLLFDTGKIEHEFFTVETTYNKKYGFVETVVTPKESKITLTKKTIIETEKKVKNSDSVSIGNFSILLLVLLFLCIVYILKKFKT